MNIIGEGFPEEIIKQVEQRQKIYGSGYTTTRTPEEIIYLNGNTSWCKLISSVDIEDNKILQDESLRGVVSNGSSLAEQFVLFNGVNENPQNQRAGIATNGNLLGNNNAYGIGGTEFGLRPMMGIQSAEIKHENRGSIRRATVKIKAFNKVQFDIIDALYLRLGFNMLLEWGHSMYFDNNGEFQTNPQNSLANQFISKKQPGPTPLLTYVDFLKLIKEKQISSNGNYDAMFAKVSNFHWSFLKDGSYDITLDLVSVGDVVESFKINLLSSPPQYLKTPNDLSEKSSFEQIKFYSNQSEIGKLMYNLVKDTYDNIDNNDNNNDIAKKALAYQESLKTPIPQISPIIHLRFTNETKPYGNFYIRLGTLLQFIEENIIYKVRTSNNYVPILNFDYDEESNLMYIEDIQTSTDPSICVINRDININNIKNNISSLTGVPLSTINLLSPVSSDTLNIAQNKGKEFDSTLFPNLPTTYGKIMNIYVNVLWILTKLNELKDSSNNKVILVDFIQNILSGINGSLGGTTNLEARIDETSNTLIITDGNPLPYKDEIIDVLKNKGYNINKQYVKFDLYGYNKINGVGSTSFIKDFSFTTEITPALSTMLTVGATANSTVVGENSTAFSKFNIGLKDRFKEEITIEDNERTLENIIDSWGNPFSNPSLQDQLKSDQIARKSINELLIKFGSYLISYLSYLNDINKEIHNPTESESYKDILNNLITYKQQYFQAQENYLQSKGKKTTIISPSTGFIPFNLSLTMDGLSGMKIYNKFLIDTEFLPANYPDYADFIIKNITHKIENNKWDTKLESIVISKGDEYSQIKSTPNINSSSPTSQAVEQAFSYAFDEYEKSSTPILKLAVKTQSNFVFDRLVTPKGVGEVTGYCAGYTYNIAYKLKEFIDKYATNPNVSPSPINFSYQNAGNANSDDHRAKIRNLGIYDEYYLGTYPASKLKQLSFSNIKWNYGDILNYYAPGFSPPTNMHTQIYTGDIFKTGINSKGVKNASPNSGWTTSAKTNYGGRFIYKANNTLFKVYAYKVKPEYLK